MAKMSYFNMPQKEECNVDTIAGKLTYLHVQLHLLHWQTTSYAKHNALGDLYEYVEDFKDIIVEKIMGYTGRKPGIFKIPALTAATPESVLEEMLQYASTMKTYGEMNEYHDICNLADEFSGMAAKTKYLLTLS
jgi:DNA-binding ferritin-like protein